MADTPAPEKPKRRTTKAAGETKPKAPRKAVASKSAIGAEAPKPRGRKPAAPKPAVAAEKPKRAPRKSAAAPTAAAIPAPAPTPQPQKAPEPEVRPRAGLLAAVGTLAALGGAFYIWRSSRAEEPDYKAVETDGVIEVRDYPSLVTAATEVTGQRQRALNEGFRKLADYLFAKSRPGPKLAMTAPVLSDGDASGWRTRFIMPTGIARANLPMAPDGVVIESEPARRVAAIRFSGRADEATLAAKEGALRSWLQMRSLPSEGKAVHAFYTAPFLPGPLRRNEVMIMLSDMGG